MRPLIYLAVRQTTEVPAKLFKNPSQVCCLRFFFEKIEKCQAQGEIKQKVPCAKQKKNESARHKERKK